MSDEDEYEHEKLAQEQAYMLHKRGNSYQPQQPDEEEGADDRHATKYLVQTTTEEDGATFSSYPSRTTSASPTPRSMIVTPGAVSPCLATAKQRRRKVFEFTYFPRRVKFENHDENASDDTNPLKVSAFVFGIPILTEREADFRLSQKVEGWKKLLFLLSNVPYLFLAFASLFIVKIDHRSFHPYFDQLCESTFAHCALACMVSLTSFTLHSSQVRVGHWCCSPAKARTFHRRRVQDKFDLADCFCAALAVILAVLCHGVIEMGQQMATVVPIFVASIVVKKLQWWNTYMVLHGIWHLATAYLLWEILLPLNSPLRAYF